jgi:hypothetical protein
LVERLADGFSRRGVGVVHSVEVWPMQALQHPLLGAAATMAAHGEVHRDAVKPGTRSVQVLDLVPVSTGPDQGLLGEFLGEVAITDQEAEEADQAAVLPLA